MTKTRRGARYALTACMDSRIRTSSEMKSTETRRTTRAFTNDTTKSLPLFNKTFSALMRNDGHQDRLETFSTWPAMSWVKLGVADRDFQRLHRGIPDGPYLFATMMAFNNGWGASIRGFKIAMTTGAGLEHGCTEMLTTAPLRACSEGQYTQHRLCGHSQLFKESFPETMPSVKCFCGQTDCCNSSTKPFLCTEMQALDVRISKTLSPERGHEASSDPADII